MAEGSRKGRKIGGQQVDQRREHFEVTEPIDNEGKGKGGDDRATN